MALTTSVTTTATTELVIEPKLKKQLLASLKEYQELKKLRDKINAQMDEQQTIIERSREVIGETKLALNGFRITRICGTHKVQDNKKLVQLGCAMAWIEEATEVKPKKPYTLISCPGEKDVE